MFGRLKTCALLTLALTLTSCLSQQQQQQQQKVNPLKHKSDSAKPVYLGTIHQIYPEHKFVLVRLARMIPKPGTTLISHPADGSTVRIANLCVSNEQIKNSVSRTIAADIRSGIVMKGDAVYVYRNLSPANGKTQEQIDDENWLAGELQPLDDTLIDGGGSHQISAGGETLAPPTTTDPAAANATLNNTASPTAPITPAPKAPQTNKSNNKVPSYIDKIPENIEDWE